MLRVAMLSFWHVHAMDYARQAISHPGVEIVAAWDEMPDRGQSRAAELGVDFHGKLADVLARADVDAVVVDTPTNAHREVMVAAADAGKHIFTEKVLALTTREATEIVDAADRAGLALMVSLPRLYDAYTRAISEVIAAGHLGTVTLVRTRLTHDGSVGDGWLPEHFYDPDQCGGGALVDLGCHPMYLARLFLGELPTSVHATYGHVTGRRVEDNAVAVLTGSGGTLGVVEAGFASAKSFSVEIYGTAGTLVFGLPDPVVRVRSKTLGDDWAEVPLAERLPMPFEQWVDHIASGTTATANMAAAVDLTRLMEAASRSAATGAPVRLDAS